MEATEARVDAVRVLLETVGGPLDEGTGGGHLLPGGVRKRDRHTLDGDPPDVLDGEVVARENTCLNHASSLSLGLPKALIGPSNSCAGTTSAASISPSPRASSATLSSTSRSSGSP